LIDPVPQEKQKGEPDVSDKDNYESAVRQCMELRSRLSESAQEREDMMKQISLLTEELRIQEQHFTRELATKTLQLQDIKKNSI
jgi:hypothetical protein